jgi:hypothetical protein
MRRLAGIVVICLTLATGCAWAQSEGNPFAHQTKWNAEESWNKDRLVYTFEPTGTFRSSKSDGGKGQGTWMRDGNAFVMVWPRYDGVIYVGTIGDREIKGSGFSSNGKSFGAFVLRLIP